MVSIDGGEDLEKLVGPRGNVLEALQELTRLAVQQETGTRSRLMLDIAGLARGPPPGAHGSRPGDRRAGARRGETGSGSSR